MMLGIALIALWASYVAFAWRRLRTFLQFYQQDEYDAGRFVRWLVDRRAFDIKASAGVALVGAIQLLDLAPGFAAPAAAAVVLLIFAAVEADPTKAGKKPLVMTERARRILIAATAVAAALSAILVVAGAPVLAWVLALQLTPLALCAATALLSGFEARNNKGFVDEARQKLVDLKPVTVGITGSFGKTSVKHILGHMLSSQAPTLITPGSVNTELGISRIVRERLTARERFFVCEMGAYGPGSIARLCRLAPPSLGVITAIGHAHYERFGSLETVASAKFELAEAALAQGGRVVVVEAALAFEPARKFVEAHRASVLLVGPSEAADLRLGEVRQTAKGTVADIVWQGQKRTLSAPLFGAHHGLNMALAFAAAVSLGMDPADAATAMTTTPQIRHRSEIRKHPSGATLIDDAYNSNTTGFAGALELLDLLRGEGGRRVLITPGMAELGAAHDAEHAKIGEIAARHVDILLPVMPERLKTLIEAYKAGNPAGQVLPCTGFAQANDWMAANLAAADVVLLENDLPDLYERKLKL